MVPNASSSIVVLVLLVAWLCDINSADDENAHFLSKSFVENGFCLSPRFNNTHTACAFFNVMASIFVLCAIMAGKVPQSAVGLAVYFFAHGYGHYDVIQNGLREKEVISLHELLIMSVILSIGPTEMARQLVKAKKMTRDKAYRLACIVLAATVALFKFYIRHPFWALLYMNIAIILELFAPYALLVGFKTHNDIEQRCTQFYWPTVFTRILVLGAIFCEPFYCDSFVASIGGHFVYDVCLVADELIFLTKPGDESIIQRDKSKVK